MLYFGWKRYMPLFHSGVGPAAVPAAGAEGDGEGAPSGMNSTLACLRRICWTARTSLRESLGESDR